MYRHSLARLILCLALCEGLVLTSSSFLSLAPNSSSNGNGTLTDIPDDFTVQGIVDPSGQPLDQIGIYQTAVATMEDLCFMDQGATLPRRPIRSWSLSQYNVRIYIRSSRVRWAIYGLLTGVPLISDASIALRPCLVFFFQQGHEEGVVKFTSRNDPFTRRAINHPSVSNVATHIKPSLDASADGIDGAAADAFGALLSVADPDSSTPASNSSDGGNTSLSTPQLRIIPRYNGRPLPSEYVFVATLNIMVAAAENGPEAPCPRISGNSWEINPIFDAQGQSMMRFHSVIKAMRLLTRWMVSENRYGEIDVELRRDAVTIGTGRLKSNAAEVAGL